MKKNVDWKSLREAARLAQKQAYAPYSQFAVGAAVLTADGTLFSGCNLENASLGLTICAERNAIAAAVAAGHRNFRAIAVCASPLATPCGACRQVLLEFGDQIEVLSFDANHPQRQKRWTSRKLLPDSFRFERN